MRIRADGMVDRPAAYTHITVHLHYRPNKSSNSYRKVNLGVTYQSTVITSPCFCIRHSVICVTFEMPSVSSAWKQVFMDDYHHWLDSPIYVLCQCEKRRENSGLHFRMLQFRTEELLFEIICKLRQKVGTGRKITKSKCERHSEYKLD
jgi:hypothetical protein